MLMSTWESEEGFEGVNYQWMFDVGVGVGEWV